MHATSAYQTSVKLGIKILLELFEINIIIFLSLIFYAKASSKCF